MKSVWMPIVGFLLLSTYARWHYVCKMKFLCDEPIVQTDAKKAALKNLALMDASKAVLSDYEQFQFAKNATKPELSANNEDFIAKAAAYLKDHPDQNLEVTGFYRPSEKDEKSGFFENLGLARAAELRSLLVAKGIPENRITLDYGLGEEDLATSSSFSLFKATTATITTTAPEADKGQQFTFTNMTFSDANFDSGSDVFKPGAQFVSYADSVVTFLKLNPNKALNITGHTDSDGSDDSNMALGGRRAKAVKQYFTSKGVKAKIATDSQGEKQPISTNETPEGKAKNRRVNIVIQ